MTKDAWTNVSEILSRRYPVTFLATFKETYSVKENFEDDGFIHIQRGKYRYVFYKNPQGSLTSEDIPRFAKGVDKAIQQVKRQREEEEDW